MKKLKINQKLFMAVGIIIAALFIYSFNTLDNKNLEKIKNTEVKLFIKSDNPAIPVQFNAVLISDIFDKGRKDLKGQTTPFELVIPTDKVKFLFEKTDGNANVIYKVSRESGSVSASWPVTVILVNQSNMETFGL